jgi:hypothetical protein
MVAILFATVLPAQIQTPAQTPFLFTSTPVSETQTRIVTLLRDPHLGVLTPLPAPTSTFKDPCIPEAMESQHLKSVSSWHHLAGDFQCPTNNHRIAYG